jgi:hypothetical protein
MHGPLLRLYGTMMRLWRLLLRRLLLWRWWRRRRHLRRGNLGDPQLLSFDGYHDRILDGFGLEETHAYGVFLQATNAIQMMSRSQKDSGFNLHSSDKTVVHSAHAQLISSLRQSCSCLQKTFRCPL